MHEAVDRIFDDLEPEVRPQPSSSLLTPITVEPRNATADWTYQWPGGAEAKEAFFETRWYEAVGDRGSQRVRVAWTVRDAWGRQDRKRAVVFNQLGSADSTTYYPWTEFVETDEGRYAAQIPDPTRPRATLSDPAQLPGHLAGNTVERTDALFASIKDGPSLRLVVNGDDEVTMVRHGYWVATLRNRI
jgi:hypothetical protein